MTVTSAIVREPRGNGVFRWMAPLAILIALHARILSPGILATTA